MSHVIKHFRMIDQGWRYDPTWSEGGWAGERYTRGIEVKVVLPLLKARPGYSNELNAFKGRDCSFTMKPIGHKGDKELVECLGGTLIPGDNEDEKKARDLRWEKADAAWMRAKK
jgi:hypothetical protein